MTIHSFKLKCNRIFIILKIYQYNLQKYKNKQSNIYIFDYIYIYIYILTIIKKRSYHYFLWTFSDQSLTPINEFCMKITKHMQTLQITTIRIRLELG